MQSGIIFTSKPSKLFIDKLLRNLLSLSFGIMFSITNPPHAAHKILIFFFIWHVKKKTAFLVFDAPFPPPSQTNTFPTPKATLVEFHHGENETGGNELSHSGEFLRSPPVKRGAVEKDMYVNGEVFATRQSASDHKKNPKK